MLMLVLMPMLRLRLRLTLMLKPMQSLMQGETDRLHT